MSNKPSKEQIDELLALLGGKGSTVDMNLRNHGEEEGLCEETLVRWLVARKLDVNAAAKDLKAHAEWRTTYMPSGRVDPASCSNELSQKKAFITGYDNDNHPVTIVLVQRHKPKDADECKRFIAYSLDCAGKLGRCNPEKENWDGKCTGIFDLRGMTMANYDVGALRAVFDLLQNHYPERLAKLYLYCAPLIFYGLWKIVSPFVDPVTKEKVVFVYEKEAQEIFARDFPPEILPPELGGTGQLTGPDDVFALLDKGEQHPNVVAAKRAKAANGSANGARGAANGNGAAH